MSILNSNSKDLIDKDNVDYYKINYSAHDGTLSFEVRKNTNIVFHLLQRYKITTKDKKILDFGFGTGDVLALFSRLGSICYGVDISPESISRLASSNEFKLSLITENRLPFDNNLFDIVVASESVEHVPDEKLILTEISRVLKNEGFFIMGVPSSGHGYNPLHFRKYSCEDIKRLEGILKARCLGYKFFGGRVFLLVYDFINKIASLSMGVPAERTLKLRIQRLERKVSFPVKILKYIYHRIFVPLLFFTYFIDSKFTKQNSKEIWFVFSKSG